MIKGTPRWSTASAKTLLREKKSPAVLSDGIVSDGVA